MIQLISVLLGAALVWAAEYVKSKKEYFVTLNYLTTILHLYQQALLQFKTKFMDPTVEETKSLKDQVALIKKNGGQGNNNLEMDKSIMKYLVPHIQLDFSSPAITQALYSEQKILELCVIIQTTITEFHNLNQERNEQITKIYNDESSSYVKAQRYFGGIGSKVDDLLPALNISLGEKNEEILFFLQKALVELSKCLKNVPFWLFWMKPKETANKLSKEQSANV